MVLLQCSVVWLTFTGLMECVFNITLKICNATCVTVLKGITTVCIRSPVHSVSRELTSMRWSLVVSHPPQAWSVAHAVNHWFLLGYCPLIRQLDCGVLLHELIRYGADKSYTLWYFQTDRSPSCVLIELAQ